MSHRLLLRAGMIRKAAAGIYSFLPLGLRTIDKIQRIIREEMTAAGAQELLLPILQPSEVWERSGRWAQYGKEMMRIKDRAERDFALAPTAEETVTTLVAAQVNSYRQLPLNVYQIGNKYRDEVRPRFGLMRAREFLMKDGYSFHADEQDLSATYERMFEAYSKIFARCGLTFRAVKAATGLIGGAASHEFLVLADTGEAELAFCTQCDYAANTEAATRRRPERVAEGSAAAAAAPLEEVHTPGQRTVEEVSEFVGVTPDRLIKTLFYKTDGGPVAVLIPGDRQVNDEKLFEVLKEEIEMMGPEEIEKGAGVPFGYAGPIGLKLRMIADLGVTTITDAVTGANKADYHWKGVQPGRDFQVSEVADLERVEAGDRCPECGGELHVRRGIETGQIFKLGTKYSSALDATYTAEDGSIRPFIMGTYGIGVGRTMAAAIEQHHDEHGISWPVSIAPFHVALLPLAKEEQAIWDLADQLHRELEAAGIEVLMDDRQESPGVKFADADLIGLPYQVILGKKTLESGNIEVKVRATGERHMVARGELAKTLKEWISGGV